MGLARHISWLLAIPTLPEIDILGFAGCFRQMYRATALRCDTIRRNINSYWLSGDL